MSNIDFSQTLGMTQAQWDLLFVPTPFFFNDEEVKKKVYPFFIERWLEGLTPEMFELPGNKLDWICYHPDGVHARVDCGQTILYTSNFNIPGQLLVQGSRQFGPINVDIKDTLLGAQYIDIHLAIQTGILHATLKARENFHRDMERIREGEVYINGRGFYVIVESKSEDSIRTFCPLTNSYEEVRNPRELSNHILDLKDYTLPSVTQDEMTVIEIMNSMRNHGYLNKDLPIHKRPVSE